MASDPGQRDATAINTFSLPPVDFCTFWPAVWSVTRRPSRSSSSPCPRSAGGGPEFSAGAARGPEVPKIRTRSAASSGRLRKSKNPQEAGHEAAEV